MAEFIRDGKGHVVGQKMANGTMLDGKGHLVGRYNESANVTLDKKGKFEGRGDQTFRLLGKEEK